MRQVVIITNRPRLRRPQLLTFHGLNGSSMTYAETSAVLSKYDFRIIIFGGEGEGDVCESGGQSYPVLYHSVVSLLWVRCC